MSVIATHMSTDTICVIEDDFYARLYPSFNITLRDVDPSTVVPLPRAEELVANETLARDDLWWFTDHAVCMLKSRTWGPGWQYVQDADRYGVSRNLPRRR